MTLPHSRFAEVVDPSSQVMTLLASHWIALKQIMAIITECEQKAKIGANPAEAAAQTGDIDMGIIRWLKHLNASVDDTYRGFNAWPMWVEAQLDRDRGYFGKTM